MDSLRHRVYIRLSVSEGSRTRVESFRVDGASVYSNTCLAGFVRSTGIGNPLIIGRLEEDRKAILSRCAEDGYLEAQVEYGISLNTDSLSAAVTFHVSEGELICAGNVRVEGTEKVKNRVVERECAFKTGDTLTRKNIRATVNRLYKTGLFNIATMRFDSTGDSTGLPGVRPITLLVEEKDFFSFEMGGGYHSYEKLRGKGEIGYSNLFGFGHKISLTGNMSFIIRKVELGFTMPWFVGLPVNLDLSGSYRWQNEPDIYEGLFGEVKTGFSGWLGQASQYYIHHRFEDVTLKSSVDELLLSDTIPVKNTNSISTGLSYDIRNDILDPSKGIYATIDAEVAGLAGRRSNQFIKVQGGLRGYWSFGTPLVFASALRIGLADPFGSDSAIAVQERFFSGGSTTLRGFAEKEAGPHTVDGLPTGGNAYLTFNILDLRFPVYRAVSGAVFFDAGNLWYSNSGTMGGTAALIDFNDIRYNVGAGLRVKLPFGIVRFDAALKIDRKQDEPAGAFQIDMGQMF
jgi:outer membrane protein insertion porin family